MHYTIQSHSAQAFGKILRFEAEIIAIFAWVCYDTHTRKRSWRDEKWLDAVATVIVRWKTS